VPPLILPATVERPSPRPSSRQFGVFVPLDALFPDLKATGATIEALLKTLSRDAVLRRVGASRTH
jgi:hypothetical protein